MNTDQLLKEVQRLRGVVCDQGETIERQSERIDELEHENDENGEKDAQDLVEIRSDEEVIELSDVWIADLPFGRVLKNVKSQIGDDGGLIDRVIDLEAGSVQSDGGANTDDGRSPLAQLIDLPREKASEVLTENQDRGCRIAQRAKKLGTNTPEGLVVKSGDIASQLRKWGESAHSETVSRVMEFITDLGKSDVCSTMHKGRRILVFDPGRVSDYGNGNEPDVIKSRRDVIWSRESGADPAPA